EPEPKSISKIENVPHPKAEPEPRLKSISKFESVPQPEPEPEPKAEPQPEPQPEPEPETRPEPEPEPKPKSNIKHSSEPQPEPEPEPHPEPEPEPHPEPEPEPEPNSKSSFESENEDSEVSTKSGATKAPVRPEVHEYTPKHDFNPMDCTDMIIGMARENTHRIGDYYTRDRSTPRNDAFWGGKDSLTAAMGFEKNGVTTIMFRRKLVTNELTDHEIVDGDMQVIWARGQQPGNYIHQPPSGVEKSKVSVKDFYKTDELKYHGHKSQRGVTTFNFFGMYSSFLLYKMFLKTRGKDELGGPTPLESGNCGGEWKYPRSCTVKNFTCEYYIRWSYKTRKDHITFTIKTKNTDTWTGIGFSEDDKMTQTDAILGWVDKTNGRPFVMDTWISGYSLPLLDPSQDIYNISGKIENGVTTLMFSRKRATKDTKDFSFTDDHCLYMMFPVKGGIFNSVNKKIRKHTRVPFVSSDRICIKSCGIDEPDDYDMMTVAPSGIDYEVEVKLVNVGDGFKASQFGTQEFEITSNRISDDFEPTFKDKIPGFYRTQLTELKKNDDNGIIAKINVIVEKDEKGRAVNSEDTLMMIEGVLKEALLTGRIGSLRVDPNYLVVKPPIGYELSEDKERTIGSNDLLLGASCTLYKATRKRMTKRVYSLPLVSSSTLADPINGTSVMMRSHHYNDHHNHHYHHHHHRHRQQPRPNHQYTSSNMHRTERLITNNMWKDYSTGAKTNFGFEAFETEEKVPPPPVSNPPRTRDVTDGAITMPGKNMMEKHRLSTTYSLPRAPGPRQPSPPPQLSYYTQDRRNNRSKSHGNGNSQSSGQQPDFYFMPSQRKYSGEVVRVYVDYGNQKPK
ncbi:GSCOCG00000414001-RA-CDS, partial [Cotesia congregata]